MDPGGVSAELRCWELQNHTEGGEDSLTDLGALITEVWIKYRFLIPLVPSVLEQVRGATKFAYNLIDIREGAE